MMDNTWADIVKKNQTTQTPYPPRVIQPYVPHHTFMVHALVFDFSATNLSSEEAKYALLEKYGDRGEGIRVLTHSIEVAFKEEENLTLIIKEGLKIRNKFVPIYRSYFDTVETLKVRLEGVPKAGCDETLNKITREFSRWAPVMDVHFPRDPCTGWYLPRAIITMNITDNNQINKNLPRQINLYNKDATLYWRQAPLYCRYCKKENHRINTCPTLISTTKDTNKTYLSDNRSENTTTTTTDETNNSPSINNTIVSASKPEESKVTTEIALETKSTDISNESNINELIVTIDKKGLKLPINLKKSPINRPKRIIRPAAKYEEKNYSFIKQIISNKGV